MDDGPLILTRHKIDVFAYHRMGEAGILADGDRVELIDGEIIDMAPIGSEHTATVNVLNRELVNVCGVHALVSSQNPVRLDRFNEPEPDFALLRPRADNYRGKHAGAEDVLALIEVSDSSVAYDRQVKLPLYARFGIAEYWIVDIPRKVVVVHRGPGDEGYSDVTEHRAGERLAIVAEPRIVVALERLFD